MTQNNEREKLDVRYFNEKLRLVLEGLPNYTRSELARALQRLSNTASPISQNEQQEAVGVVYDRYLAANEHGMYLNTFYSDEELELEQNLYTSPIKQMPDGWKLVPIEPTEEMLYNVDVEIGCGGYNSCGLTVKDNHAKEVYKAMLNASPSTSLTSETNTEVVE